MSDKKVKREVAHPKLYLRVGGKLQHVKKGTQLTVTEGQAARLGAKLVDPAVKAEVDVSTAEAELKAAQAKLDAAKTTAESGDAGAAAKAHAEAMAKAAKKKK